MKMWTTPQVQNELIADLRKAISRANEGSRTKLDNGSYDSREWLSSGGAIDDEGFSSHIQAACGYLWLGPNDFRPLDSLQISPKTLRATGLTHGLTHVPVVIQEVNQTELELLGALCISMFQKGCRTRVNMCLIASSMRLGSFLFQKHMDLEQ